MTDSDQRNRPANGDHATVLSFRTGENSAPRAWGKDDFSGEEPVAPDEAFAGDLAAGITSLGFIRAAVRRRVRLWGTLAFVGLIAGVGLCFARPAAYQATTSVLITNPPGSAPGVAVQDDTAIVQSRTVAGDALRLLGLTESPAAFVRQYTSTVATGQLLDITVRSPSATAAVREANALARAFLAFQARMLLTQESLVNSSLDQRLAAAEQNVSSLAAQITRLRDQPGSQAQLRTLLARQNRAQNGLTALKQAVASNTASTQVATTTAVEGSQVLDPAVAVPPSEKKRLVLYGGGGLFGGLVIGMAIVVIGAVTSERLRRRDDISRALGAPVRLSVGAVKPVRATPVLDGAQSPAIRRIAAHMAAVLPVTSPVRLSVSAGKPVRATPGLDAAQSPAIRRIAAHLAAVLPRTSDRPASLALVPVDDAEIPALCLASLAVSCAKQAGIRVMVADLCQGGPLARLLDAGQPGVHTASVDGVQLVVFVPDAEDLSAEGPLRPGPSNDTTSSPLAAAGRQADLLLTLAPLDPATGGDYLPSWAETAVVTVTAGRSSAARINAVGEMIRLAGLPLMSAVLLDADKADESLGVRAAVSEGDLRVAGLVQVAGPEVSS